jgi:DNA-binding Lrp family transcriptional regulator
MTHPSYNHHTVIPMIEEAIPEKNTTKSALDDLDKQILALLKEDSSKSFKEIADIVGKTEATVRRRVKRMRDEEYIKKFTIVLNDKKINEKKVKATIKILPELKMSKMIAKKVASLELVDEAYLLSGECGILIKVSSESVEALTDFIENEIGAIQGVRSIDTCFIMKVLKEEL